jgi:flavin-dependent dehydrogenase
MSQVFDGAVVGGGPAGAVTAIGLARRGWRVVILEASSTPADRFGETLPPEINPLLWSLGLSYALARSTPVESPGIVSCWDGPHPSEQDFIASPYGMGWHVDRLRFDEELRAAAELAGVTICRGVRVGNCVRENDLWRIGGVSARTLIDASGRNGLNVEGPAARQVDDTLLVLVLRFAATRRDAPDLRTYIEAVRDGWWYRTPLPDGSSIAMFFTGRSEFRRVQRQSPDTLLESATTVRTLIRTDQIASARWTSVSSSIRKAITGLDWLAVGDSASSYDPLSGRGIYKAIRHGSIASEALDQSIRGDSMALARYQERVCREYREYITILKAHYAMQHRWPESSFWARRR